ncbi:hypothetical protein H6G20_14490 [Desertifilum sp. FACHB-1129]|uniref:Iron-containing redox enzyme family protein n=1 Tax=Desertifilum tharense IPPAS B-1220 TaxID=1781255 RepID=A0A1E5QP47_9CYAN|nr:MULTISPECIES: hypothetical protein [Desertifilum]MDA0213564.1 hypothetical protein [Cyanobacteria bacterium FC1]MBD2312877.1 hypothetical protein [Desertifilum sp. FACHB-1129]MBD2323753.1 hypothetical protein [Desertifilum sp. FACHB-866]MBD2333598.1 hypothetical protein [Desertifilum sp. FACHB-868]OEJ76391.1 hypothetical protein BH720_04245 [Desertifilum tharense IPPAS B-1220]
MKEVLAFIQQHKKDFAELSLFKFLRDTSIDPRQRLAWAPCLAPFAMNFKDINAYAFRQEPTDNPIQELINRHSYEDGSHWAWYLKDLEVLGIDETMKFSDALRFLWGDETQKTRHVSYDLFALSVLQKDPILKLVVIESIEVTGTVALAALAQVGEEIEKLTGKRARYFSAAHLAVESGHIQAGLDFEETENFLENIHLSEETRAQAFEIVERVFSSFTACINEQMAYAESHDFEHPFTRKSKVKPVVSMV